MRDRRIPAPDDERVLGVERALGLLGTAGGVNQQRWRIGMDVGQNGFTQLRLVPAWSVIDVGSDHRQFSAKLRLHLLRHVFVLRGDEEDLRVRVAECIRELRLSRSDVERHGNQPGVHGSQETPPAVKTPLSIMKATLSAGRMPISMSLDPNTFD